MSRELRGREFATRAKNGKNASLTILHGLLFTILHPLNFRLIPLLFGSVRFVNSYHFLFYDRVILVHVEPCWN